MKSSKTTNKRCKTTTKTHKQQERDVTTTKRHKTTTNRCKMTTKIQKTSLKRCKTTMKNTKTQKRTTNRRNRTVAGDLGLLRRGGGGLLHLSAQGPIVSSCVHGVCVCAPVCEESARLPCCRVEEVSAHDANFLLVVCRTLCSPDVTLVCISDDCSHTHTHTN